MDTNVNNYNVSELVELIELPKKSYYTLDEIEKRVTQCIKQAQQTEESIESKEALVTFMIQSFQKICKGYNISYGEDRVQTLQSHTHSILPKMSTTQIYEAEDHPIIQHASTDSKTGFKLSLQRGITNPLLKQATAFVLNINTRFRPDYFHTKSTDFIYTLPNPMKNVVGLKLISVEIPLCIYNLSSQLETNEFTVQRYTAAGGAIDEKIIKIRDGFYNGEALSIYLNTFVFTLDNSLNYIACEYDLTLCKFRFFYDFRDVSLGGAGPALPTEHFNLDFRLHDKPNRPIQLNMGWIMGYKQAFYEWDTNYVQREQTSYNRLEGYNPEGAYDNQGTKYFLLSIDDYNNNYVRNLVSPFQEGVMKDSGLLAKIQHDRGLLGDGTTGILHITGSDCINKRREYFGPVNIDRMHIQLLDELGRPLDLNNTDFSFSLEIDVVYDL